MGQRVWASLAQRREGLAGCSQGMQGAHSHGQGSQCQGCSHSRCQGCRFYLLLSPCARVHVGRVVCLGPQEASVAPGSVCLERVNMAEGQTQVSTLGAGRWEVAGVLLGKPLLESRL